MGWKHKALVSLALIVASSGVLTATVVAQSSSSNYRVNEYFFGAGGELDSCSDSYCSKQTLGETTVGSTESDNFIAQAGFNTTDVPLLEVAVNGSVDFGVLSTAETRTGFAEVQVRTYLASGYVMQIAGPPPTYSTSEGTHSLAAPSAPALAQTGQEQFGINLRDNTTPNVGADPVQLPDNTFSFGLPMTDYNAPDQFMYVDGATVAYSTSSSGQTNYIISMIANMSQETPAGVYTTELSVVVTSTF